MDFIRREVFGANYNLNLGLEPVCGARSLEPFTHPLLPTMRFWANLTHSLAFC